MNLRKAKVDDYWRNIFKRSFNVSVEKISFTGDHLFQDFDSVILKGLTCIVGKNGIGKSTFIRSLHNAFYSEDSNRNLFNISVISSGSLQVAVRKNNAVTNLTTPVGQTIAENNESPVTSFLFDPCSTMPMLQQLLSTQDNLGELLEGFQEVKFTEDELQVINYLTGNIYQEVTLFVIEDEFEAFSTFPFFKVVTSSSSYDSRNMGLGELSLFYFFWLMNYINKFEGDKILFIEEPESFLPPMAQNKLANVLAHSISEFGISCLLSTHSEHILKRVPRSNILIFQKDDDKVSARIAIDDFEYLKVIGLAAPKMGLLLFEDSAAFIFFKTVIKFSKKFVADSFYYQKSGSESDIVQDLERFPGKIEDFRIIGIFDGDAKGKDFKLPATALATYLPSDLPPEELIIKHLKTLDVGDIARFFDLKPEILKKAFEATNGCDIHDFFPILSQELGIPYEYIFTKCCDSWASAAANEEAMNQFLTDFNSKVN